MDIRSEREKLGLTQKELAELLNVTPATVCQWEKGVTEPRERRLKLLTLIFRPSES